MKQKLLRLFGAALLLTSTLAIPAYAQNEGVLDNSDTYATVSTTKKTAAGSWVSDSNGWRVQRSDGTFLMNQWYQSPASGLWYYLGADGYMLTNTMTPDGLVVDENGVWVIDVALWGVKDGGNTGPEEAKQGIYDLQNADFLKKRQAVYNYLESIGYDTGGLSIKTNEIHFSDIDSGEESLYYLLAYDSQAVLNEVSDYVTHGGNAEELIQAVENYLDHKEE